MVGIKYTNTIVFAILPTSILLKRSSVVMKLCMRKFVLNKRGKESENKSAKQIRASKVTLPASAPPETHPG